MFHTVWSTSYINVDEVEPKGMHHFYQVLGIKYMKTLSHTRTTFHTFPLYS